MGHPMVPKITIAVAAMLRSCPRRVFPPSNAAAGGVPFPAVGAPALRPEIRCGVSVRHARGFPSGLRARRRATTGAVTVRRAVARSRHLELLLRAAATPAGVRGTHADRSATAQVHRSGASPGRAQCAAWTVSITPDSPVQPRLSRALDCRALYPRHHGVTTKILLGALEATGLKAAFRPRHYRISAPAAYPRIRPPDSMRRPVVTEREPLRSWQQPPSGRANTGRPAPTRGCRRTQTCSQ